MKELINELPFTKIKLFFARFLYKLTHQIYRNDKQRIIRGGINYEVDLSEGTELSLFLFGNFQKNVSHNEHIDIPKDGIIFDIGANTGIMTLQFAKLVPYGKVYSFEPTHYAFSKLKKNLELNSELSNRVIINQCFISEKTSDKYNVNSVYASWNVGGSIIGGEHKIHGGTPKSTEGVCAVSLDDFAAKNEIKRIDFIKIDTDGHELKVFKGAVNTIKKHAPHIIFEIGLYLVKENGLEFKDYAEYFDSIGYSLYDSNSMKKIDNTNYFKYIPLNGTTDILAIPNSKTIN
ncbi:MAG: FkbM family methyltransferase [Elusimicrobia bacterium]|nr:FkbM family methyltransferase [Candidatus Liberimonas magnetica]